MVHLYYVGLLVGGPFVVSLGISLSISSFIPFSISDIGNRSEIISIKFYFFFANPHWDIWSSNWFINKIFVLSCFLIMLGYLYRVRLVVGVPVSSTHD